MYFTADTLIPQTMQPSEAEKALKLLEYLHGKKLWEVKKYSSKFGIQYDAMEYGIVYDKHTLNTVYTVRTSTLPPMDSKEYK